MAIPVHSTTVLCDSLCLLSFSLYFPRTHDMQTLSSGLGVGFVSVAAEDVEQVLQETHCVSGVSHLLELVNIRSERVNETIMVHYTSLEQSLFMFIVFNYTDVCTCT